MYESKKENHCTASLRADTGRSYAYSSIRS